MTIKKLFTAVTLFALSGSFAYAYDTVDCSTDASFATNSCNQCFLAETKAQGDNIGFLSDVWSNVGDTKQLVFKEEQDMPRMVNLDETNVSWTQTPSATDFWAYTEEFDNIYDETEQGYILNPGQSITWLKSKLGYAYKLEKNTTGSGSNIGMLIYPIVYHEVLSGGDISVESITHNECVLFKSGESKEDGGAIPPKKLPDTGPEHVLLVLIALILGFAFFTLRKRA